MRKEDKSTIIEQIAATVKEYGHFYLVDTTAMNAADTSALRALCFKADIKLMVVKNTLLQGIGKPGRGLFSALRMHEGYNRCNVLQHSQRTCKIAER